MALSVFKPWGKTSLSWYLPCVAQGVARKMVREQRVDVDAVTGATTTSRALQLAAADLLRRCAR